MSDKILSSNSDQEEIKKIKLTQGDKRSGELDDIKEVLSIKEGRRFIWRILSKCGAYRSIWEQNSKIHYNAGQQDLGHFIMAEITEADEELLFQMMREQQPYKQGSK